MKIKLDKYKPSEFYDKRFTIREHYNVDAKESKYYDLWLTAITELKLIGCNKVMDLGCGPGQTAQIADEIGLDYIGIDFSEIAIKKARIKKIKKSKFFCRDISMDMNDIYNMRYNGIISIETIEHLKNDINIIKNIPHNIPFIFSVPNFDADAHVMIFETHNDIIDRYDNLLEICDIEMFAYDKNIKKLRKIRNRRKFDNIIFLIKSIRKDKGDIK